MEHPPNVIKEHKPSPLILVSNPVPSFESYQHLSNEDLSPRVDYMEVALRIGGQVTGHGLYENAWYNSVLRLEKRLKLDFIESFHTTTRLSKHNVVISASERSAIPLAALLSLLRREIPLVVISHHISSINKSRLFGIWPLYNKFSRLIFVCRAQADYAIHTLGIPPHRVDFIYDKVDQKFFHPEIAEDGNYILAVGQEQRDYRLLVSALENTGIKIVIVASSPWSQFPINVGKISDQDVEIMCNVSFRDLRDLYAHSRIVVVPLHTNNYAAGVNSLLEGMAMGKPVISSFTPGTRDYISNGVTGRFTPPGNAEMLKDRILSLWSNPRELNRLGENGRTAVENSMNFDIYVENIVRIARSIVPSSVYSFDNFP
jgi:glycosyltransferase involved in cell wall biosynthesis